MSLYNLDELMEYMFQVSKFRNNYNEEPFISVKIDQSNQKRAMVDIGYYKNMSTRFWRVLKIANYIARNKEKKENFGMLFDIFVGTSKQVTDSTALCVNYFIKLGMKGGNVGIEKAKFIEKVSSNVQNDHLNTKIEKWHKWCSRKLYPYRNILLHKAEPYLVVVPSPDYNFIVDWRVLDERNIDMCKLEKKMNNYASIIEYFISEEKFSPPNYLTGENSTVPSRLIDDFCSDWIEKLYNLQKTFVEAINTKNMN